MANGKVLYIGGFELPDKNAAAQRVMANATLLREMGFEVSFIGPTKDSQNAVAEANGFSCDYVDYPSSARRWLNYILSFVSTDRILSYEPDYVVLYNFPSVASLKILRACHRHGIKVYHDLTEWEGARGWSFREIIRRFDISLRMKYCMKKMDGIIAISRFLYEKYKDSTNCILVPPTVDLENPKWDRERELTTGSEVSLIYAGTAGFGTKDKLDAIINAVTCYPSMKLTVIGMTREQYESGYGPLPEACSNVCFRGRLPHLEAVAAVCAADFQMLIREDTLKTRAGFPTKLVESFSCCTPVIATLTSNIGDYLSDARNGFIVASPDQLGSVLGRIAEMPKPEIIAMKRACKDCSAFDYRTYKEEFSKLFNC